MGGSLAASPAAGFSIYGPDVYHSPQDAPRWSAERLEGGIRVGVPDSFIDAFGPTTTDTAIVRGWVEAAFAVWQNPALQFDIHFGDVGDAELVFDALPGDDPLGGFYGYATPVFDFDLQRVLTNGQVVAGYTIESARIDIAAERLQAVGGFSTLGTRFAGRVITRLLMHEIGHTLGLGHTNSFLTYFDTDLDPTNPMVIDPANPFAGLVSSSNRFEGTVMSNQPCGEGQIICLALLTGSLTFDDIGGRDVLYPALVPEPALGALLAIALLGLCRERPTRSAHDA